MSEIISLHLGGSGIKVGLEFWQQLTTEQKQYPQYHSPFFQERQQTATPRAIFMDMDCRFRSNVDKIVQVDDSSKIFGNSSITNLYGQGRYLDGQILRTDHFAQALRKQAQKCDRLAGCILTSNCTGGAGSGLCSSALVQLREQFSGILVEHFNILPETFTDEVHKKSTPIAIYNTIFNLFHVNEYSDVSYTIQNRAVQKMLYPTCGLSPKIQQINRFMGTCLTEHTASYRYPGPLNNSQRKRTTNLIMHPRLKYIRPGISEQSSKLYVSSALRDSRQLLSDDLHERVKTMSLQVSVRDPFAYQQEINEAARVQVDHNLMKWLSLPISVSITAYQKEKWGPSAWTLVNSPRNVSWMKILCQDFRKLYRRKAFFYHYMGCGIDEMELNEAESSVLDQIQHYQDSYIQSSEDEDDLDLQNRQ